MKLIDILVQELPKRGGWPERAEYVVQDCDDTEFYFFTGGPVRFDGKSWWFADVAERDDDSAWIYFEGSNEISDDHDTSIISRKQYEAALAASKPEWNGEYPIPAGTEVEVHFDGDDSRVWTRFRVEYMAGEIVVLRDYRIDNVDAYKHKTLNFRPIRSEADKKRAEAIKAIDDAQSQVFDQDSTFSEYLYDAIATGKIPHIRID